MSDIQLSKTMHLAAGVELWYITLCDCGQHESFVVLEQDLPIIHTAVCGAEYKVVDRQTIYPLMATCNTLASTHQVPSGPTIHLVPNQPSPIQGLVPPTQQGTTWLPWYDGQTGERIPAPIEPEPTECYCFQAPVNDCPTHGISSGKGRKARNWPHIDWK